VPASPSASPIPAVRPPDTSPRRLEADLGMLLVTFIWGLNFTVTKGAFRYLPPLAFTGVRFAFATALLVPLRRRVEGDAPLPAGALPRLVLLGIVGNTLYQLAFVEGLARTTASNSALILASMPTLVAVGAGLLGMERVTRRMAGGIAIATAGVVLVVAARGAGFSSATLPGDLLTLGAVVFWAAYTLGLRALPPGVTSLRVTTVTTVAGMPGLVLAGLPQIVATDWRAVAAPGWIALAYSTLFSLVVAYLLWNRNVRVAGPSRTVVFMCVTPIFAVASAWLLLGEVPVPLQAIGAGLIIGGVLLTRR
jgi:drug/metabolite transporter (DMT)-like permease